MKNWFHENQSAFLKWGQWYYLSLKLWEDLSEHQFLMSKWVPAYLLGKSDELVWDKKLTVDLGAELSIVEAQLFQLLSKQTEVFVLSPGKEWRENTIFGPTSI